MNRIRFVDHNGTRILFLDFSSCEIDQAYKAMDEAKSVIKNQDKNSLRVLTDVSGATFDTALTDAMKEFAKHNKPYVKASAMVGVSGIKKIVYQAVIHFSKRNISLFDDLDSAKAWLVQV